MDISEIINYMQDNNLADVEEKKQNNNISIVEFSYDFDKDELNAAKSYANDESDFEPESDEWYNEYYIPFLKDIAIDNVEATIEEIIDDFEIECRYKEIENDRRNGKHFKFIAIFSIELSELELEDILNEYN